MNPNSIDIRRTVRKYYLLLMLSVSVVIFLASNVNLYLAYLIGYATKIQFQLAVVNELLWWLVVNFIGSFILITRFLSKFDFKETGQEQIKLIRSLVFHSLLFIFLLGVVDLFINIYYAVSTLKDNYLSSYVSIYLTYFYSIIGMPIFYLYAGFHYFLKKTFDKIFQVEGVLFQLSGKRITIEIFTAFILVSLIPLCLIGAELFRMDYFKNIEGDKIFIIGFIFQLIVCFATYLLFTRLVIINPLSVLMESFKEVQEGNFSAKLPAFSQNEIGLLIRGFNSMVDGLKDREWIKDTFGLFLSPEVAKHLLNKKIQDLSGEEKEATILFTDIENYTGLSEKLNPSEVISMLNNYFNWIVDIIVMHGGIVNKYIGDSVMAIFNVPVEDSRHAFNAVACALEIIQESNKVKKWNGIPIKTRIGVNTGRIVAGSLGSEKRMEYTVIGDAVNIAQRLEAHNKILGTQLLIGEDTFLKLEGKILCKPFPGVILKGKVETVTAYSPIEKIN